MDKHLIVSQSLDEAADLDPFKVAGIAFDLTMDGVVALLRRKEREHAERGNKISALIVADILKEFYK